MKSFKEYKQENFTAGSFFHRLMEVRTQAHAFHLGTKSYSEHKALDEFYNEILNLADDLIETYQGQYGLVKLEGENTSSKSPIDLLERFVEEVKSVYEVFKESHLKNILDEIVSLTYKTLYKLKHLK